LSLKKLVKTDPILDSDLPNIRALRARLNFDEQLERQAVGELYKLGSYLYDRLFPTKNEVRSILKVIENYGTERNGSSKYLRVLIYSNDIYLPWQLLHLVQPDNTNPDSFQFWGNKYILGVNPSESRPCGRLPDVMKWPEQNEVLYAHYWQKIRTKFPDLGNQDFTNPEQDTQPDRVSVIADQFADLLNGVFMSHVNRVHEKDGFWKQLKQDRRKLKILWTYTHGHSGTVDLAVPMQSKPGQPTNINPGPTTVNIEAKDIAGQRIDFSSSISESMSVTELDMGTVPADNETLFFAGQPLVFLNGCETGTEGSQGTTELSFPGVFIRRGARAAVVTEAIVWDSFAYYFGEMFLRNISSGAMDAGEALLHARRQLLSDSNNPLGLLYSYYGPASLRIAH
jgi:hypothetical protein